MYDSPMNDFGYDISDYENVYPGFGTLQDMDTLIQECHSRGMKIILDLVINHTSDQHAWFKESRLSKDNAKRDWYIWKPPRYDSQGNRHPPNNWGSYFSGSAWKYDELTNEYYLHLFAESQPDLNWENEDTRQAIFQSAIKFWLDRGVDGFRIDTAGMYSKHQGFKDAPIKFADIEFQPCKIYHQHGPRIHEFHKAIADLMKPFDVMTVGEVGHSTREESLKYVSAKECEMNMMFLFDVVELGTDPADRFRMHEFNLLNFKKAVKTQGEFIEGTDAWSTVFIENHDFPRSISRFGNDSPEFRIASGKALAMLQCCLTGTEFIFQGQEIGMVNVPKDWTIDDYKDIGTLNYYKQFLELSPNADAKQLNELMKKINLLARDNARTPMQWDSTANAGFTSGTPWMRVNDNYQKINVKNESCNPDSLLSFWKKMIQLRKQYKDVFIYGHFKIFDFENPKLFTFLKEGKDRTTYTVINFSTEEVEFEKLVNEDLELLQSTSSSIKNNDKLSPYEGRVYLLKH